VKHTEETIQLISKHYNI